MRCQKETKQTKEQVPQRGFKETQVLAVVNRTKQGQNERRKNLLPQNKNKEALVSDNEESDDEE